jgi:hypothetical protein
MPIQAVLQERWLACVSLLQMVFGPVRASNVSLPLLLLALCHVPLLVLLCLIFLLFC